MVAREITDPWILDRVLLPCQLFLLIVGQTVGVDSRFKDPQLTGKRILIALEVEIMNVVSRGEVEPHHFFRPSPSIGLCRGCPEQSLLFMKFTE